MVYYLAVFITQIFFKLAFRHVTVRNVDVFKKLKETNGFILAPNHISNFDPVFIGAFTPPKIYFLAKKELFASIVSNWVLTQLNALPINRAVPEKSVLQKMIRLLGHNECVMIFPEGTRSKSGELKEAKLGISMIAAKAKVPVLPCLIQGTNQKKKFFSRPELTLTYGDPIYLDEFYAQSKLSKEDYARIGKKIMQGIAYIKESSK